MAKHKISVKFVSVLLLIAMLVSYMPIIMTASAAERGVTNRVTDSSTMNAWEDFFLADILSTKNSGAIWTDKSVFLDSQAFAGTGITLDDKDAFLVALSLMGSNSVITGMSHLPTDTMLVLDVSGSMNDNNNDVAQELVQAANATVHALLSGNKYNRVGVVLYSDSASVMLPLNRYTTASDGNYFTYTSNYGGENISIDSDVYIEGTNTKPTAITRAVSGGTYIQTGIDLAKDQFIESTDTTVVDPSFGTINRMPIMVLMTDGAPTYGSTDFQNLSDRNLGNGSQTTAALGFVNQLTAAYAKALIEEKYDCEAFFYTLGLGVDDEDTALSVLDPNNANASVAVNDFWTLYNNANIGGTVTVHTETTQGSWERVNGSWQWVPGETVFHNVTKIETPLNKNYVNEYFEVTNSSDLAQGLIDAFEDIVNAIQLKSRYYPTLTESNPDVSGNVSFVDKIGKYMTVTDVKGILIHNTLFSGADLAKNFAANANGGVLGTPSNPTALGNEMVWSVQQRLGLSSADEARTLIELAYQNGQLSYTSETEFSNYIGWYANAAGEILGFWHEGITTMPDPADPTLTDATRPAFIVKSYGYLGEVDEEHGVDESDLMYATVQVRKSIATGEELVTFSVPAALIPIITYNITLDEDGDLTKLEATGADHPIRLVYEVALKEDINEVNITEKVSADYIAKNTNPDGSINFYTNQYEVDNTTGYGKVNTYSYFNPSKQNERYYYTENSPIYTNTNGTLYTSDSSPLVNGTYYRSYKVYEKNGDTLTTKTVYRQISSLVLATAKKAGDNTWYIPAGDIHVNMSGMTVYKGGVSEEIPANNKTGTLKYTKETELSHLKL
ncbi:MAG: VWA domain-containing protein [Ruminococcaceae bacterium]|nr:VWA domain-containing protein [Oscillospiraceae bacterium]